MKKMILIFGLAAALVACSEKQQTVAAATKSVAPAPAAPEVSATLTGRVLETMNAAGYTYLRIEAPGGERWAAVPETAVKKGSTVTIVSQMVARDFESTTLGRKFDAIVFGTIAGNAPPMTSAAGTPAQHMKVAASLGDVKVAKAEGGLTIAEVWSAKNELKDKPVIIRGTVVKFLPEIMGKNWIHLRDGSGQRDNGTDDITVTTRDVARAGDVVTVSGTLRVDKDFGSGYVYGVIVEDAEVRRKAEGERRK